MIEYLKEYNITIEQWDLIENNLSEDLILNLKIMEDNVCEVLSLFKELGIKNLANIIIYRPDLCFKTKKDLQEKINKIDIELLKYIINHNIDDLNIFNI